MRIISGKYKSRRIQVPANMKARPTTDFAKEGLFNVLHNRIDWEETEALDLFSGTGSIALELVSRGCPRVVSVEMNNLHWRFICKAKETLGAEELLPLKADVFKFLPACNQQFDLIFADPPYDLTGIDTLPDIIFSKKLLKPEGIFLLEHSKKYDFSSFPFFTEERKYGNVHFSFFAQEA
ncbi:MAG: RsmD family RNA methyltransferase [Proteiniphilum sp.]|nr:RsmD family RNA methyltransferase [Proteiniphilum sp.]